MCYMPVTQIIIVQDENCDLIFGQSSTAVMLESSQKVNIENTKDKLYSPRHKLTENHDYRIITMV